MTAKEDEPEIATNEEWRGIMVRARREHGLSQAELGERVGCTQVMISKLESGAATASEHIRAIARVLAIPLPQHFEDEADKAWHQLGHLLRRNNPDQFQIRSAS